jgi:hypothetical protein
MADKARHGKKLLRYQDRYKEILACLCHSPPDPVISATLFYFLFSFHFIFFSILFDALVLFFRPYNLFSPSFDSYLSALPCFILFPFIS